MKTLRLALLLPLLTLMLSVQADEARFFRIAGPVANTITRLSADGYVTWTNASTNATFIVQTASSLFGPSNWVDYVQVPATNLATTERLFDPNPPAGMSLIPAGSFTMGDSIDGSGYSLPLHTVYISEFYMDKHEVTKTLWDKIYNWAVTNGYIFSFADSGQGKDGNHPVQMMTWHDAVKWCNARSEMSNLAPAYYLDAAQTAVYRTGQTNIQNAWANWIGGYRLPTEAEWEKAARGGLIGLRFGWGNTITHNQANYYSSATYIYDISPTRGYNPTFFIGNSPYTSPVGYFQPNGYGLYDMTGNVWEWCWDWADYYTDESVTDPLGPTFGTDRVYRGGSWVTPGTLRVLHRSSYIPTYRASNLGFRCVLSTAQ